MPPAVTLFARRWLGSPLLESFSIALLGMLLVVYFFQNKLTLLIRSNYVGVALLTGVLLMSLGVYRAWQVLRRPQPLGEDHPTLFSPGWAAGLLLMTALLGLTFSPRPLSSQTAINRGTSQNLSVTRTQPQAFRVSLDPGQRSLIEWVRTLNAYPDPQSYEGQPARIEGFVLHPPEAPPNTFWLSQFVIGCCAADAYPVGLPVVWSEAAQLPLDSWQRVQGSMRLRGTPPELFVQADSVQAIPTPTNPYAY